LIGLEALWKRSWMGSILNMILIGWIVYYTCIRRGCKSVTNGLFKRVNVNKTIEKGQQLWSSINKYVADTVQALNIIVDSLIDHSTSLCFAGLYLLPTAFLHGQLYITSSSLLCSWLLVTAIYGCNKLRSLLLLDVQYKTAPLLFWPCSLLVLMEIISVASSRKFPVEPCLSWGGGNEYWHGD
jgi:hypothetical protein